MIAAILAAIAAAAPVYGPDRIHYDLDVVHTRRALTGTARIAFHNPFDQPLTAVWLRRWDGAYRRCHPGCTRERVRLPVPVPPDGRGAIEVPVDVRVPRDQDRFGRIGPIDVFGNGLPTLAVSRDGARPALPPYTFDGESSFTLTARWTVDLTLRPGEQVASTGVRTARDGNTVRLEAPAERDFFIVAGPMAVRIKRVGGVRLRWFSHRDARPRQRRRGLRLAARSLRALQRTLGPYGAPELDAVQNAVVAMEYPNLVLTPPYKYVLTHELAHQWFYRLVGNDQWRDPWVDETMTSFAAARLGRRVSGAFLKRCRPRPLAVPVDASMARFDRRPGRYSQTIYVRAPCHLLALEERIGERRMGRFLRALVAEYRGGVLTSDALRRAIAALPTGRRTLTALRVRAGAGR